MRRASFRQMRIRTGQVHLGACLAQRFPAACLGCAKADLWFMIDEGATVSSADFELVRIE